MKKTHFLAMAILILTLTGLLLSKSGTKNREVIYESLGALAEIITVAKQNTPADFKQKEMVEGAIDGLLEQLDPHSSFYNKSRYQTMREDQRGAFFGIGVIVGYQNDHLTVISPLDGTPAAKAGIRAGDVISQIDGAPIDDLDFYDAIRLLRGNEGAEVVVQIMRPGMDEPLSFPLNRAEIPSNNVRTSFMVDQQTGYVALKDFGESASIEVSDAVGALQKEGMRQLILDLRGNPGGLLPPEAIKVSSLFIPGRKLVVSTKGRLQNANQEYSSESSSTIDPLPLVVLIDRGSASASEIVAGAIQDHDRGLILGVNSWGKGLVQSVFPLGEGNKGMALTTSRYYTPSGRNIQGDYASRESYYNPESSERIYFEQKHDNANIFKTVHGRDVFEVRGITPDVYIDYPEVPKLVQKLQGTHSAFFNFATRYQDKLGVVGPDWEADNLALETFRGFLEKERIEHADFDAHQEIIKQQITQNMLYIRNQSWAWHFQAKHDPHIHASLDMFQKAEELLHVYKGEASIPSNYTSELRHYAELKKAKAETSKKP